MKRIVLMMLTAFCLATAVAQKPIKTRGNLQKGKYYLYCHMNGGLAWTAYAVSKDGFHFEDVMNGDSVFSDHELAKIEGRTRDAFICRRHDGKGFLMVTTDMDASNRSRDRMGKKETWDNYGINLLTSPDLIH